MKQIVGREGQNIYDIAYICYGSYDILKLMQENPFINNVNYNDFAGKTINYTPQVNNPQFVLGLNSNIINTGNNLNLNYLLQENGYYLLMEDGYKILL